MAVKPIPRKLLFHSISYEEFLGGDGYGDAFASPITIANVRLEPKNAIQRTNIRDDTEGTTILFIDQRYSTPFLRPIERSKITFGGKRYEVSRVDEFYADRAVVHHLEVTLV